MKTWLPILQKTKATDSCFTGMGEWHETADFAIHLSWAVDVYAMGNG